MITVEEAKTIILQDCKPFGVEQISLENSITRILKEDWLSDRPLPPYDRITMDGIAISFDPSDPGKKSFFIKGVAAAGSPQMKLSDNNNCLEVMTGAVLPLGTDTVIRYEEVAIENEIATVSASYRKGQNIHTLGQDRKTGELLVASGQKISPAEIGVGASIGKKDILVATLPKVMVISTGDELVEIDQQPEAYQIRKSNVYRIGSTLRSYGISYRLEHLDDKLDEIVNFLETAVEEYDVIILSGGVSKGKFDFIPEAMERIGVEKLFHKIQQRPGKPFWFGKYRDQCTIFALPGNPVSSFMCTQIYFMEWLSTCLGEKEKSRPYAILQEEVSFRPDLSYFLEVKIEYSTEGKILAFPKKGNGSGDLANLCEGDAFIHLPQGEDIYLSGKAYPIYFYR